MAKGNINLHIGTTYDGEGFKKLNNALKASGTQVKRTSTMVNQVVNSLGNMDSKAGKVVGTIGNLVGSFATMGFVGLLIGGISSAFQLVTNHINESKKAVKDLADALKNRLLSAMGDAEAKANLMMKRFEKTGESIKHIYKVNDENLDRESQDKSNEIRNRHIDTRKNLTDENEFNRDKVNEQYELGVLKESGSLEKARENQKMLTELLENQKRKQEETQKALDKAIADEKKVNESASEYFKKRATLISNRETVDKLANESGEGTARQKRFQNESGKYDIALEKLDKEYEKDVERLKKSHEIVVKAQERNAKSLEELTSLTEQVSQARLKTESAEIQYQTNMKSLKEAQEEHLKAIEKKVEAEKKSAELEKERLEKEKKRIMEEEKRKREREEEKQQRLRIKQIQDETSQKLKELNPAIEGMRQAAEQWKKAADESMGKSFGDWKKDRKDDDKKAENEVNLSVKNTMQAESKMRSLKGRIFDRHGKVKMSANQQDIDEYNRLGEYLSLQPKSDERLKKAALKEQKKLKSKIFDKHGKLKNSASVDDIRRWRTLRDNFVDPSNPVEDLKQKEDEKNRLVEKQATDIEEIKQKLEKLGL